MAEYRLALLNESSFWPCQSWPAIEAEARRAPLVVLPVFGLTDWGLGLPLDIEETLGSALLNAALENVASPLSLLPPWRFGLAPYSHVFFGLDPETALTALAEIGESVRASGFHRLLFFNTSPWNRELIDVAAADLRITADMQTFAIHLDALGLDFHPHHSTSRTDIQRIACHLLGRLPDQPEGAEDMRLPEFRPGQFREPAPLPFRESLSDAIQSGATILTRASERLAALLTTAAIQPSAKPRRPIP